MGTPVLNFARHRGVVVALYGLLSLYFCWPLFASPNGLGIIDWDVHFFYYGSVLKSVVEYAQMPFWNPWYCGGNVLWQNPQIPLLSPAFPLTALVSLPLAMKINIVLHYFVGLIGMHLLLTEGLGLTFRPAVVYLSSVVVFSGAMALHLAVGHSNFLPCLYLPLQLHFFLRAMRTGSVKDIVCGAALLALMVFNGAMHVMQMGVASIGALALCLAVARRDWRPLAAMVLTVILGCAYAAPKLLPVSLWVQSERFRDVRNVLERPDAMTTDAVVRAYVDRYQNRGVRFDGQRSNWSEYGNYIGGLAAALVAAAMFWPFAASGSRERWLGLSLAITSLLMLVMSAGEFSTFAPASIATHLPLLSSFRIPSRYTIPFVLLGTASIAWMLRESGLGTRTAPATRWAIGLVCLFGTADVTATNRSHIVGSFGPPALTQSFKPLGGPTTLVVDKNPNPYGAGSPMFSALMNDRTFYNCYEPLQVRRVANADDDLVTVSGGAKISDVTFSPNRIEFTAVGGPVMSEISINQNLSDGWSSTIGPVIPSLERQRPAARLGPGQSGRFAFTFRPPGLIAGTVIMLLALAATVAGWRRTLFRLT